MSCFDSIFTFCYSSTAIYDDHLAMNTRLDSTYRVWNRYIHYNAIYHFKTEKKSANASWAKCTALFLVHFNSAVKYWCAQHLSNCASAQLIEQAAIFFNHFSVFNVDKLFNTSFNQIKKSHTHTYNMDHHKQPWTISFWDKCYRMFVSLSWISNWTHTHFSVLFHVWETLFKQFLIVQCTLYIDCII